MKSLQTVKEAFGKQVKELNNENINERKRARI